MVNTLHSLAVQSSASQLIPEEVLISDTCLRSLFLLPLHPMVPLPGCPAKQLHWSPNQIPLGPSVPHCAQCALDSCLTSCMFVCTCILQPALLPAESQAYFPGELLVVSLPSSSFQCLLQTFSEASLSIAASICHSLLRQSNTRYIFL